MQGRVVDMNRSTFFRSLAWRCIPCGTLQGVIGKATAVLAFLLLLYISSPEIVLAGSNDYVGTFWRTDNSTSIPYSGNYLAGSAPLDYTINHGVDFTTGWLSVNLANVEGTQGGLAFSQVGVMLIQGQLRWFVYAEPGVTCLDQYSFPIYGNLGCAGNAYVALN